MSDLDNAINSINASAAKAENTAGFLDDMSTFDDQSSVTNPNNGQTVASIPKQVKDRTDELFTTAESDINQAVADAEQSATDAQDAADSIGRYQGLWPDTGGSANKGDTYQTQVSGTPTGQYFTALQNTTVDPIGDDVNWRVVVSLEVADNRYEARRNNSTFIFEGDSITEGNTIGGYKYSDVMTTLGFASGWITRTLNRAVGGSQIASGDNAGNNISDRYASQVYPHRPTANGGDGGSIAYLFLLIGTNDLDTRFGNKDALTIVSQMTTYIQQAMTDGFTVVLQTILPRKSNQTGWDVQTEQYRLAINANIRRGTIPADIVADTESFVNDVTSTTMFHDGIHPTVLGADMIATYLNNVMLAGGSLETGNVLQGRAIQGLFSSKDKTMVQVGEEYMRTSLGTDYNNNKNGFLIMENLNPSKADSSVWIVEAGVDGDNLKFMASGDGLTGSAPAMSFGRNGLRAWWEAGSVGQKTIIGTPQSDNDSAPIYMGNLSTGLGVNESNWGWVTGGPDDARPSSLFLRTQDDGFTSQKDAIEFKRVGDDFTSMAVLGSISTTGDAITPGLWGLGNIKAGTGIALSSTKYVEVEINGELVRLGVINDPTPS